MAAKLPTEPFLAFRDELLGSRDRTIIDRSVLRRPGQSSRSIGVHRGESSPRHVGSVPVACTDVLQDQFDLRRPAVGHLFQCLLEERPAADVTAKPTEAAFQHHARDPTALDGGRVVEADRRRVCQIIRRELRGARKFDAEREVAAPACALHQTRREVVRRPIPGVDVARPIEVFSCAAQIAVSDGEQREAALLDQLVVGRLASTVLIRQAKCGQGPGGRAAFTSIRTEERQISAQHVGDARGPLIVVGSVSEEPFEVGEDPIDHLGQILGDHADGVVAAHVVRQVHRPGIPGVVLLDGVGVDRDPAFHRFPELPVDDADVVTLLLPITPAQQQHEDVRLVDRPERTIRGRGWCGTAVIEHLGFEHLIGLEGVTQPGAQLLELLEA